MYCALALTIYVLFVNMVIFDGPLAKAGRVVKRLLFCGRCHSSAVDISLSGDRDRKGNGFFSASPSGRKWSQLALTLGLR